MNSIRSTSLKSKALLVDYPDAPRMIEWDADEDGAPFQAEGMDRNGLTVEHVDAFIQIYSDATFEVIFTRHDESAVAAAIITCRPGLSKRPDDPLWNFG